MKITRFFNRMTYLVNLSWIGHAWVTHNHATFREAMWAVRV